MKKLLLTISILLTCFQANAQYRFYAGLEAGPKVSFSNTTLYNGNMAAFEINQSAPGKLKYQLGAVFGYTFKNPRFSLETGFSKHQHAMIAQFRKRDDYPAPPELRFAYNIEQIPIMFKTILNDPTSKVRMKLSIGGAWVFSSSEVAFEDESIYNSRGKYEPYSFPYTADRPETFAFDGHNIYGGFAWTMKENWLLLTGFESETNLSGRITLSTSLQYQTSIRPVRALGFEYNYNYQTNSNSNGGTFYEAMEYGTLQSKAEAINLNVRLTYAFGKRSKNS